MTDVTFKETPRYLASLVRGLYARVARQLDLDPSYVSRIARGERESELVDRALRRELNKIVRDVNKQHDVIQLEKQRTATRRSKPSPEAKRPS
jgi:hypothetical protein